MLFIVNELTETAIKREIYEEVGIQIEVGQLAFVVENHFSLENTDYHQIEFHYVVTPLSSPNSKMEVGGQIRWCEWVSLNELDNINLNPAFLKKALINWDSQLKHIVNKDGED